MSTILEWLSSLTAAGSVVAAFTLLLRFLPANSLPAIWRYRFGQLALGCFLVPIAASLQWIMARTGTWHPEDRPAPTSSTTLAFPEGLSESISLSPATAAVLLGVWAAGAVCFAVWHLIAYRSFIRLLEQSRLPIPTDSGAAIQLTSLKEVLMVNRQVRLAGSPLIRTPLLVGLWRPTIYLPAEHDATTDLSMILRHELIHLKHKDLWIKAFMLAVSSLQWFNPLVHMLRKEIHTWSEFSCDEAVVRDMSHDERKRYGETILGVMLSTSRIPAAYCAPLSGEGQQLKRRLTLMLTVKKAKKKTLLLIAASFLAITAISTTAAVWASDYAPQVSDQPAADVDSDALVAFPEDTPVEAPKDKADDALIGPAEAIAEGPLAATSPPNSVIMPFVEEPKPAVEPVDEGVVLREDYPTDVPAPAPPLAEAAVVPADESGDIYPSEAYLLAPSEDAPPSDDILVPAEAVK